MTVWLDRAPWWRAPAPPLATVAVCLGVAAAAAFWLLPGQGVPAMAAVAAGHTAPVSAWPAVPMPAQMPVMQPDAALPAAPEPAVPQPALVPASIQQQVGGKLGIHLEDADRRHAIERLADATGSTVYGIAGLPPSLGRVTLKASGIDTAAAWQLLLNHAPVGFALACHAGACDVWFAVAGAAPGSIRMPVAPLRAPVESTEEGN